MQGKLNKRYVFTSIVSIVGVVVSIEAIIFATFDLGFFYQLFGDFFTLDLSSSILFLLGGIGLYLLQYDSNLVKNTSRLIAIILLLITLCFLLFSFFFPGNDIGPVPPAVGITFMVFAISIYGIWCNSKIMKLLSQYMLQTVILMSFFVIVTYIFGVNKQSHILYLNTVSLYQAILMLLLSIGFSLKNADTGINQLFLGNYTGNRFVRISIPLLIFFPLFVGYVVEALYRKGVIDVASSMTVFTVIFIVISVFFSLIISILMNKSSQKNIEIGADLFAVNNELVDIKNALDMTSIVAITDKRGVITYINDKFCELSKYNNDEIIGNTHSIVNSGYHPKSFFTDMWKTISQGKIWVGEIKNKAKDGSIYWVHTSIVPFKDSSGKIYQYLSIRQDITQKKHAEELLNSKFVEKLQQKNVELEQFAYIASHDLQEPLRSIKGLIKLLNYDYGDKFDENGAQYLKYINESVARMSTLIADLLAYSRLSRNNKVESIDCNELFNEIKEDLSQKIVETYTSIHYSNMPVINAYRTPIRQLFQNLITNAIKFREKGVLPEITIDFEEQQDHLKFSVHDNGIGIEKKNFDEIFTIFKRLHSHSEFEGSGIGLANCKKIVELHEGEIWVESEPRLGSTFHFTISKNITNNDDS